MHLDRLVTILGLQLQIRTVSCALEGLKLQEEQRDLLQQIINSSNVNTKGSEKLKPVWMVPISRNPEFVGREEVLEQLESKLLGQSSEYQQIAVLHGLGGIG